MSPIPPDVTLPDLQAALAAALSRPLPGERAHRLLAPVPRHGWNPGLEPGAARDGAGLLLVFPRGNEPRVLLTVRTAHLSTHRGQVSLPGGSVDPGETIEEAALREAWEETGVMPGAVRLLGRLSPLHIPVSGFILHPVVAITHEEPMVKPFEEEVARILEVPVRFLLEPNRFGLMDREVLGRMQAVPYFDWDGERIWGATAMVLAEFLWILGHPPDPAGRMGAAGGPEV